MAKGFITRKVGGAAKPPSYGNATPIDVKAGKTFSSGGYSGETGTLIDLESSVITGFQVVSSFDTGKAGGSYRLFADCGVYLALRDGSGDIAVSFDGVTWNQPALSATTGTVFGSPLIIDDPNTLSSSSLIGSSYPPPRRRILLASYERDGISHPVSVFASDNGIDFARTYYDTPSSGDNRIKGISYDGNSLQILCSEGIITSTHRILSENAGDSWTALALDSPLSITYTYYGNGRLIGVGVSGGSTQFYLYSAPSWISAGVPVAAEIQEIVYGNGRFIGATPDSPSKICVSENGLNWRIVETTSKDNGLKNICYGNGIFCGIIKGAAVYSLDGIGWKEMDGVNASTVYSICIQSGYGYDPVLNTTPSPDYIVVSKSNGDGKISLDTIMIQRQAVGESLNEQLLVPPRKAVPGIGEWTASTAAANNRWTSVCYGNGLFVAVSDNGTGNRVMTSPDGINWTIRASAYDSQWRSVCYGNGLFVATGTSSYTMISPDGINWTNTGTSGGSRGHICYGNGLFVASAGTRVMTSSDGIKWISRTSATGSGWTSVCYGNGLFVAVGSGSSNLVVTSPDGINWTARAPAAGYPWESVCYGNGLFVAVSSNSGPGGTGRAETMTSSDGINWTIRRYSGANFGWKSVCYGDGLYVVVSDNMNYYATSLDGSAWSYRSFSKSGGSSAVCYGNGLFVAVGGNQVMTAPSILQLTEGGS